MLKKIFSAVLLSGFIGILIFGGVYRTKARTSDYDGRNVKSHDVVFDAGLSEDPTSNSVRQARNGALDLFPDEDCDEEGYHRVANEQTNMNVQNGSQVSSENQVEMSGRGKGNREVRGPGNGKVLGGGLEPLSIAEIEALKLALNDEYHASAVYKSVIEKFGEIDPFVEIAASEQRHIDALVNQFIKHELPVPENTWIGNISAYDNVQQACKAGFESEIANVDLFDQLFSMTDDPGLTKVFRNLRNASMNSHLPKFEACQ